MRRIVHTIEEKRLFHGCTKPVCQVSQTRRNSTPSNQEPRFTNAQEIIVLANNDLYMLHIELQVYQISTRPIFENIQEIMTGE